MAKCVVLLNISVAKFTVFFNISMCISDILVQTNKKNTDLMTSDLFLVFGDI